MPFTVVRNDITKMKVDAIVNAANTELQMGGGVCGSIFKAAGISQLQASCNKLSPIKTGEAAITPGFALPAKFIVHAAGPVYRDGKHGEEAFLRDAYTNSLRLAVENKCESIAFPLISSGIYGYPKADALSVATSAIRDFIADHDIEVYLAVWDKKSFALSETLLGEVESYIDEHYIKTRGGKRLELLDIEIRELAAPEAISKMLAPSIIRGALPNLETLVGNLDEPFAETLLRLIDKSGKTDAEIYKRANIDRRLFSKIRSNTNYAPSKPTVLAFAVALRLTLDQAEDLLERAGFALSHSRMFDVIVEYFIVLGKYDIFEINNVLFEYDQPLLGG